MDLSFFQIGIHDCFAVETGQMMVLICAHIYVYICIYALRKYICPNISNYAIMQSHIVTYKTSDYMGFRFSIVLTSALLFVSLKLCRLVVLLMDRDSFD